MLKKTYRGQLRHLRGGSEYAEAELGRSHSGAEAFAQMPCQNAQASRKRCGAAQKPCQFAPALPAPSRKRCCPQP